MTTWTIPNKYQNTPLNSIRTKSLNLISLSLVTEQPWSNQHVQDREDCACGLAQVCTLQMRTEHAQRENSPCSPICLTQGRTKSAEFHMAPKRICLSEWKTCIKQTRNPLGLLQLLKIVPGTNWWEPGNAWGCLPLTRPSGCRAFCFLILQIKKWYLLPSCGRTKTNK